MADYGSLILFVDIDGVLNTRDYLRRQILMGNKASRFIWCPIAVAYINLLTEKLDARIIVTSTWRYEFNSLDELKAIFKKNEINPKYVIGKTPSLIYNDGSFTRGDEICAWIEENDAHEYLHIILDDKDNGISKRFEHFIQTEESAGFANKEHIKRCLLIAEKELK